ncbi:MAG: hypothetical protein K6C99_05730 [Lachnospiraceae bacterium]|nr:hypothetical protein [Lachnospiraceae bacterium]
MKKKKKSKYTVIIILLFIVLLPVGLRLYLKNKYHWGEWQYDSWDEFRNEAYFGIDYYMPEDSKDQKFYYSSDMLTSRSIYAFTLEKESYDDYIALYFAKGSEDWYLKRVEDVRDPYDNSYILPVYAPFEKVIDDDIRDYQVLDYYPIGAGHSTHCLLANPVTGRIVAYHWCCIH